MIDCGYTLEPFYRVPTNYVLEQGIGLPLHTLVLLCNVGYIEDIQVFGVNMSFISLSEVKKIYIS